MRFLTTITTLLLTIGPLYAQVSNVRVVQRTDGTFMVDIWYDFNNPQGYDNEITVKASDDNGASWNLYCISLTGDLGENITAGTDKHIVWDFYADHPNTSGNQFKISITSLVTGVMTDYDGNVYRTVKIGSQWWMAENLKVKHYNDGATIATTVNNKDWTDIDIGAYSYYDNNSAYASTYGCLYNWHVVDPANPHDIAPSGWHVPTDDDWKELERTLGMSVSESNESDLRGTNEGSKLAGSAYLWASGNLTSNVNFGASGFMARPGGYRNFENGYSLGKDLSTYFWSASSSSSVFMLTRALVYHKTGIYRMSYDKNYGFSVRLVKD